MQHLLSKGKLLDDNGNLAEAGYAFDLVREYNRKDIKAPKGRIKEWDYYYIGDEEYGIALTIDDNSYMGLISVSVLDYTNKTDVTKSIMKWFTYGKTNLPSSSKDGSIICSGKGYDFKFYNENGHRHLICQMKNVSKNSDFFCDICLEKTLDDSMVIATPFNKKRHFYYNQKINLLEAKGHFEYGLIKHEFTKALGVLDWGRGVWTYSNTWYWSSLNAYNGNDKVGFNLGYGFGDTSKASENMFFLNDKAYKLEDIVFDIPKNKKGKDDYLKEWNLYSKDRKIELVFRPIIDRASNTNALIIQSDQHQVFGYFSGKIQTKDINYQFNNLIGFAEKVKNRW